MRCLLDPRVHDRLSLLQAIAEEYKKSNDVNRPGSSHDAVIRVYDDTGNVIETHEHAGDFKEWSMPFLQPFDGYFPLEESFSVMVTLVR